MKFLKTMPAALLLMFCIACTNSMNKDEQALVSNVPPDLNKETNQPWTTDSAGSPQQPDERKKNQPGIKDNTQTKSDWDKKIIKNATLNIEVKNYKQYNELLHEAVKKFGGYIAQEEQNQSEYKIENIVTVKVPVDQFADAVLALTPDKEKILERKITSQDVTGEVVDTKSRMEAKRQVRLRYLDLLKQAKNMEEILQVQNEINEIQEQIEGASGRIQYLSHAAALSTIHLTFFQVLNPGASIDHEPGFFTKVIGAFKNGLSWVGNVMLALITLWPFWLLLAILWVGYKKWKSTKVKTSVETVNSIAKN